MEDRVHLPCWWESEFVGGGGDDLFYFKWSFSFRGKFSRRIVEVEVFVVEPDSISDFPRSETGVYAVLHYKGSFFVSDNGFLPSFGEEVEAFF